ncbi:hypothetical protein [Delftia lacustris]|uniref:hypothetical protein n=1 Tax=Delftia lacustris TaxID=558537 RepID=UPI0006405277|nr:hypothetical protein [Delftia lacustris]
MKVRALKKRAIHRMLFATRIRACDRTLEECRNGCIEALERFQADFLNFESMDDALDFLSAIR